MRRMGIDPGLKRVGLSICDDGGELASPHRTLVRKDDASLLDDLCREAQSLGVGEIVMGLPLRLSGEEGPEAKRARRLAQALERKTKLKVVLWDERLTTSAAERELRGAGLRGDKKKAVLDQVAATLLLPAYLDAQRQP